MAQYDGSIRISTEIDSKEASSQLMTLENRIVKTADKVASLRSKMDALGSTKIPTDAYTNIQKEITSTENKLINLYNKQERFLETGGKEGTSTYKRMSYEIGELERKLQMAQADMQNLVNTGKAFTLGSETEEYSRLGQQLQYAESELSILNQRHQELQSKNTETESSYVRLGEAVRSSFSTIGRGLVDIPIAAVKKGAQSLVSVFSGLGNIVKNGLTSSFKRLGSVARSAFSKITQHANKSGGALSTFAGRIKQIAMSFFIFNQIRKIFSSTVNAIKEGFSNLYNDNLKFKSSVDDLKASLLTLKNTLASAFAPIVETAIPYIQRLVEWVTKAADAVGQLVSALMGRKTYTKAIKQTAAATDDAAKATKKEAQATEEAQEAAEGYLSPLDEINKYKKEEVKNSKKITPEEIEESPEEQLGTMFEEVPISDKFKDIAKWLKDMWEKSDFYELGKFLGEKLKSALDSIPWDEIKEISRKIGKSLATLINGFVEVEGLGLSIGRTLAEAINTGFEFLNAFVHNLHWESIGKFISETINGFFADIDWGLIYDTFVTGAKGLGDAINSFNDYLDWVTLSVAISNMVNTFVDTIYTFFNTVNWKKIGENVGRFISDSLSKINWLKSGQALGKGIQSIFVFLLQAVKNIKWGDIGTYIGNILNGLISSIDLSSVGELLGTSLTGLFQMAIDFAKTFDWKKLGDNISNGINGFFATFDGAKFAQAATSLISGFLDSIIEFASTTDWSAVWKDIIDFLTNVNYLELIGKIVIAAGQLIAGLVSGLIQAIEETDWGEVWDNIVQAFKDFFQIHSPSKLMEGMGKYIVQGLINGIKNLVGDVEELWKSMKQKAVDTWNTVKDSLSDTWSSIKQTSSEKWQEIKQSLSEKWSNLKNSAKTSFESIGSSIKESWENAKNSSISLVSSMAENIREKFSNIQSSISNFGSGIQSKWQNVWSTMQSKVQSVMESVKSNLNSAFEWISKKIQDIQKSIKGISTSAQKVTTGGIGGIIGGGFSSISYYSNNSAFAALNSAPIPRLATGAVIPANKEFLAVLGDQKHGTNIEAPLDTIKQATEESLLNVLSRIGMSGGNGGGTPVNLTLQVVLDKKVLGQAMVDWGKIQQMATGNNPYALGAT